MILLLHPIIEGVLLCYLGLNLQIMVAFVA